MEAAVHEQQPHSVSRRTHRHDQRQRQVHRQRNTELLDGVGDHPRSVPSARRSEHHRVSVLRFQPACHARRKGADARRPEIRLLHGARLLDGGLDEFHTIGHRDNPREALDDIGRTHAADKRHRPVRVPVRLFAVRGAVHVRDAPQTDRFGGFHARFEHPDSEVADVHGASERRQVHENQTIPDRDGVRRAISSRNERAGGLPLQLA